MRDAFARYVGHARKVSGTRRSGARRSSATGAGGSTGSASNAKEIREWARERGMEVSERGRVSAEVREAYDAAH